MTTIKIRKGLACLSIDERKRISRLGGLAAHKEGVAHKWNSEQAREASRRSHINRKANKVKNENMDKM